jgi:hypothetical protein
MRVEHEYERGGALAYLVAWDVHRARPFGRCGPTASTKPTCGAAQPTPVRTASPP